MTSLNNLRIISIDGNIGSGKSSFVSILKDYFRYNEKICFLEEPIDIWNEIKDENNVTILENYYKDQIKYAFTFQMMAYISRLSLLKKEINKNKYNIIITERSINTDKNVFAKMLYDEKKIDKMQYEIYLKWFNNFIESIPPIEVIYIKTTPNVAYERVKKRSREGESTIEKEYLNKCHEYHELWLNNDENVKIVFDGNLNIYKEPKLLEYWIKTIKNNLYNNEGFQYNEYNEYNEYIEYL